MVRLYEILSDFNFFSPSFFFVEKHRRIFQRFEKSVKDFSNIVRKWQVFLYGFSRKKWFISGKNVQKLVQKCSIFSGVYLLKPINFLYFFVPNLFDKNCTNIEIIEDAYFVVIATS